MIKTKQNGERVWVTFTLPSAEGVEEVLLSGEWNGWRGEPMKAKKNGEFFITKSFKTGSRFQFGYKINGEAWMTDSDCPAVASPFYSQNSLIEL